MNVVQSTPYESKQPAAGSFSFLGDSEETSDTTAPDPSEAPGSFGFLNNAEDDVVLPSTDAN